MGLYLAPGTLSDWLEGYGEDGRAALLEGLERHVGSPVEVGPPGGAAGAAERIGSYTSYDIFRLCLRYVTAGDFGDQLDEDDEVETEVLSEFRGTLPAGQLRIPGAAHFLQSGDTDTVFVPLRFDEPFEYDERFFASLPNATDALVSFSEGLSFDLEGPAEPEAAAADGRWLPAATAKNVSRLIYDVFTRHADTCVMLG